MVRVAVLALGIPSLKMETTLVLEAPYKVSAIKYSLLLWKLKLHMRLENIDEAEMQSETLGDERMAVRSYSNLNLISQIL